MMVFKALLLFALPAFVLSAGGALLGSARLLGGERAPARTAHTGKSLLCSPGKRQHLNLRLCGYGVTDAAQQWGGNPDAAARHREHAAERRFLQYDLLFPLFYGGALCIALWLAWSDLGRPFAPAWLLGPVLLGVVADWVENLVHLDQLGRYTREGAGALSRGWIQLASWATSLKLVLIGVAFLLLAALALWLVMRTVVGRG